MPNGPAGVLRRAADVGGQRHARGRRQRSPQPLLPAGPHRSLASFRPQDEHLYIRTGWEFNGDGSRGPASPRAGLHRRVPAIRRQFPGGVRPFPLRVERQPRRQPGGPGGLLSRRRPCRHHRDGFYYNPEYNGTDAVEAWHWMVHDKRGLRWHQDSPPPTASPRPIRSGASPATTPAPYIERAKEWFDSHDVVSPDLLGLQRQLPGQIFPTASSRGAPTPTPASSRATRRGGRSRAVETAAPRPDGGLNSQGRAGATIRRSRPSEPARPRRGSAAERASVEAGAVFRPAHRARLQAET